MSAADKRRFLFRAFYPLGTRVCEISGMPGASFDVNNAEYEHSQADMARVPDELITTAVERAKWMSEVVGSDEWHTIFQDDGLCPECGEPCGEVTLPEILVKFYIAMRLTEEDADGQQLVR